MGKRPVPIVGVKKEGGLAAKSKQIQKAPRDKTVAGFAQKKSDKFQGKDKKAKPRLRKKLKEANIQARHALASGEVTLH